MGCVHSDEVVVAGDRKPSKSSKQRANTVPDGRPKLTYLILGSHDAGKTTLIKHLQLVYRQLNSRSTVLTLIPFIRASILGHMCAFAQRVLDFEILQPNVLSPAIKQLCQRLKQLVLQKTHLELTRHLEFILSNAELVETLAKLDSMPPLLDIPHMHYLLDALRRSSVDDYEPTSTDILRLHWQTVGTQEVVISTDDVVLRLVDVGGTLSERRKWKHTITSHPTATFIFVVALDCFTLGLEEAPLRNRMLDARDLLKTILSTHSVSAPLSAARSNAHPPALAHALSFADSPRSVSGAQPSLGSANAISMRGAVLSEQHDSVSVSDANPNTPMNSVLPVRTNSTSQATPDEKDIVYSRTSAPFMGLNASAEISTTHLSPMPAAAGKAGAGASTPVPGLEHDVILVLNKLDAFARALETDLETFKYCFPEYTLAEPNVDVALEVIKSSFAAMAYPRKVAFVCMSALYGTDQIHTPPAPPPSVVSSLSPSPIAAALSSVSPRAALRTPVAYGIDGQPMGGIAEVAEVGDEFRVVSAKMSDSDRKLPTSSFSSTNLDKPPASSSDLSSSSMDNKTNDKDKDAPFVHRPTFSGSSEPLLANDGALIVSQISVNSVSRDPLPGTTAPAPSRVNSTSRTANPFISQNSLSSIMLNVGAPFFSPLQRFIDPTLRGNKGMPSRVATDSVVSMVKDSVNGSSNTNGQPSIVTVSTSSSKSPRKPVQAIPAHSR